VHRRYERSELQLFSLLKWPLTFTIAAMAALRPNMQKADSQIY
jgi:hypothetical protein